MTRFVLNRNDGIDTLHADPLEQCNQDDAKGRMVVDNDEADRLMAGGFVRRCGHCNPEPSTSAGGTTHEVTIPAPGGPAT